MSFSAALCVGLWVWVLPDEGRFAFSRHRVWTLEKERERREKKGVCFYIFSVFYRVFYSLFFFLLRCGCVQENYLISEAYLYFIRVCAVFKHGFVMDAGF